MTSISENRFPEGVLLTAAALLGAVMVLAGLVLGRQVLIEHPADGELRTASPSVTGPSTTTGSDSATGTGPGDATRPETTEPPVVTPLECPTGIDIVICEAADFVQVARERPFQEFPEVEILPDADFDVALLDDFDSYRAELEAWEVTLTALGLLDPEIDLVQTYRDSLALGVVGFYDPLTGRLVVRGDEFDLYSQLVLVHELTHALDDQWFGLDRQLADGEADFGFSSVVEGNAVRVENEWRDSLGPDDQARLSTEEAQSLSADELDALLTLPAIILEIDYAPYTDGFTYTATVAASGGEAAVDDALTEPPTSSEEILHPSTDRSTDPEVVLDAPPAGGEVVEEGRLGELMIRQWLGRPAGTGWGGDRYVSWVDGTGRSCIVVDLVGDDDAEQDEVLTAAESWAGAAEGRTIEEVTVEEGTVVRAAGCS
jgi:hypothetical protein